MKRSFNRLTAILLVLAMFFTLIPAVSATDGYDNWWQEYVDTPMDDWSIEGVNEDGVVTSQGNYILFTSDLHRYTYLTKDLLAAANNMIQADGNTGNVGLVAFGGDFANEYDLYADNMSILKAAIATSEGTVAAYTKGNHERNVSDDQFKELTGMSRVGETVVNADNAYYFYNFGVSGKDQTFLEDDINDLADYLAAHDDGKPVFIVSHFPIHYYNDRRVTKNAAKLVEVLNQYPQTVFLWGHNHTESDPAYGYVRSAGDVIQTEASVDSTVEINFTYANLGALRDGTNGANGLLVCVEDGVVNYRYINLHNSSSSEVKWTDRQGNENTVRVPIEPDAAQNTETNDDIDTVPDLSVIQLSNIKIDRPLVDVAPAETAGEYSARFDSGPISWTTADGPVTDNFDFNTVYTASLTLSAEDGFTFPSDASVSVNKVYVGPMPGKDYRANVTISEDGKTVTLDYSFAPTTAQSEVQLDPASSIIEGKQYVVAAIDSNYAASYIYIPEDHGEESKPDNKTVPADIVIRDGKLVSVVTDDMLFTAQKDNDGYIFWSDASLQKFKGVTEDPLPTTANFLNMSTRGGDLGLEAAESLTYDCYCDFNLDEEGLPYIDMDGAIVYAAFVDGAFTFVTDSAECNVRLYEVGDNASNEIYNVNLVVPAAGVGAEDITCSADAAVQSVSWDGNTATIVVAPADGMTLASLCTATARVNGDAADAVAADGQLTITYTYPDAHLAGAKRSVTGVEVDAFTDGGKYIIVSGGVAMTAGNDGVYQAGAPVTVEDGRITSAITTDMIITVEGNSEDGYALKTETGYAKGYSANGSPDTWGITWQDEVGLTVKYIDGKLEIISTGSSGGGGGGGGDSKSRYYYENNGHFNFNTLQPDDFTIYEVTVAFNDVAEPQYYAKHVAWAAMNGIASGTSRTTFGPNADCTRAEALTFLYRLAGKPAPTGTTTTFVDVDPNAYYYNAVLWAVENKITSGTSKTTFSPDKKISRAEFVAFLYRYAGKPAPTGSNTFTDVKEGDYYYNAAVWGAENKVVFGTSTGVFSPNENCSRAQVVTFLHRYAELPS